MSRGLNRLTRSLLHAAVLLALCLAGNGALAQVTLNCSASYQISHTFSNGAKWDMCWERNDREGIIYSDIHYTTPAGIARKVLNAAAIAQIHVPYDDNGARYHDVSDYGLGTSSYLNDLQAVDCPNGTRLQEGGKNMVCRTVYDNGISAYDNGAGIPSEVLSVFSVSHVGAYNYIPEYRFHDTGMIEPVMGATGRLQRYGNNTAEGWTVRTGANPVGISHLHNYYWKLDFDLGSSSTDDVFEEIEFTADGPGNTTFTKSVTAFSTETARSMSPATKRFWRVRDDTENNSDGLPISYDILALDTGHRDTGPTSEPWTFDDIYATRYRACERFISHNPSDPGGCGSNGDVTDFVNGESLSNQDLVVWFGITFHHIPRDEDETYMHAHWNHFRIIPRDWTAGSVNDINFAPVVNQPLDQHSLAGSSPSLQIVANDINGDTLSYSASGLPAGLSIDPATGLVSGTLSAPLASYPVDVTVTDGLENVIVSFDWYVSDDPDMDGVVSSLDNCPTISNASQVDTDNDGIGDACDVTSTVYWSDDFEGAIGWNVNPQGSDTATTGQWAVGDPDLTSSSGNTLQLGDASSGTNALVTDPNGGSSAGNFDIDNGTTSIRSPAINLPASGDIDLSFDYYFNHLTNSSVDDFFSVTIVDGSYATLATPYSTTGSNSVRSTGWQSSGNISLNALQGQTIYILVAAADAGGGSLVEAGIDNIVIEHTEADADLDGIADANDNCPNTANNDQADADSDGIGDVCDTFPNDPDNDIDGDGISGHVDNCPAIANATQANIDGDGFGDACDPFPNDPDNDIDGDGISGIIDNCPTVSNATQLNGDGDALGDACDPFPNDPDNDIDGDGVSGDIDNCPAIANAAQTNADGDSLGDACDAFPNDPDNDIDGDGIGGDTDNCPAIANATQANADGDSFGDACDAFPNDPDNDIDGDGVGGDIDNCPAIANADQLNTDGDLLGNACDLDDDNDGLTDLEEASYGSNPLLVDTDGDGIDDAAEVAGNTHPAVPDYEIPLPLWPLFALLAIFAGIASQRYAARSRTTK